VVLDDGFNLQALNMAVGTWMEWLGDEGQMLRGKLSWKSEVTGTYIFVNRKGMKIGEMSVADVADLLRGERAQILEQTEAPLMERALAAMVNALKQGQEARPPAEVPA
jgi:dihydroxyacetone kinase DhaKLM complex PTS-EIIA-like component DhaM